MATTLKGDRLKLPASSAEPTSPSTGDMYYDTTDNIVRSYNGTSWDTLSNVVLDGSSSSLAGESAKQIKADTGTTTDGLYWIEIPGLGAQQVYCDMNTYGGGWMLAMRIDSTLGTGTVRHYFDPGWWNGTSYSPAPSTARTNGEIKTAVYTDMPHEECMLEYGYGSSYWANRAYARYTQPTDNVNHRNTTMRYKQTPAGLTGCCGVTVNGYTTTQNRWVRQETNNTTFFPSPYLHINYVSDNAGNDYFRYWFGSVTDTDSDGSSCNQIGGFGMFGDIQNGFDPNVANQSYGYTAGNASATISPPYGSDPNTCQWNDTRAYAGSSGKNHVGSSTMRISSDYYNNGVGIIWVR